MSDISESEYQSYYDDDPRKPASDTKICPDCKGTGTQPNFEHQRNVNYVDSGCRKCRGTGLFNPEGS